MKKRSIDMTGGNTVSCHRCSVGMNRSNSIKTPIFGCLIPKNVLLGVD
ncbi:MAG: hypothetical protein OCD01_20505 [Fibrobacterales bacterium]